MSQFLQGGKNDCVTKPVKIDLIFQLIMSDWVLLTLIKLIVCSWNFVVESC